MSAEERPLAGRTVVVTRPRAQSAALAENLEALGAEVVTMPLLEVAEPEDWEPADSAIRRLAGYDWLVLTSANGVESLLARMRVLGVEGVPAKVQIAAVGTATAECLRAHELEVALIPADFRAEGLVEEFAALTAEASSEGRRLRVLVARAEEARQVLPDALVEMGCEVDVVTTYRTAAVAPDPAAVARLVEGTVDVVTLTSGAIARRLVSALAEQGAEASRVLAGTRLVTIGPVTSAAVRALGLAVSAEAAEATTSSLVEAVVGALGEGRTDDHGRI